MTAKKFINKLLVMRTVALLLNSVVFILGIVLVFISGISENQIIGVVIFFSAIILNLLLLTIMIWSKWFVIHHKFCRDIKIITLAFNSVLLLLGLLSVINSSGFGIKQIAKAIIFFPTLISTIFALTLKTKDS